MAKMESSEAKLQVSDASTALRVAASVLRAIFIFALIAVTIRVSLPQSETIWTAYETPGDLVRVWLGIGVCIWLVSQLFYGPKDAHGYRTWLYLGLIGVPFALICLFAVW
jgi:hypothetical protein